MTKEKTDTVHKNSYALSLSITIFLIGLYYNLIKLSIPIHFPNLTITEKIFFALIEFLFFALVDLVIFQIVCCIKRKLWKRKNKDIWVDGLWLSIHIKKYIRIGTVEIEQSFYSIRANGHNISPPIYNQERITPWRYYIGGVENDKRALDFIGCYTSRRGDGGSNDGLHMLQKITSDRSGYVNEMRGRFSDVVAVSNDSLDMIDVADHQGQLCMFRISKACEKYLRRDNGTIDYERLRTLHTQDIFKNEPYSIELNKHLKTYATV